MSLGHSYNTLPIEPVGLRWPWQYRVRPALFLTVSSIVAILLAVGGLVLARRLTGALNAELTAEVMLPLALVTTATLSYARIAWRRSFPLETPEDLSLADLVLGWASSTALALLAVGCCYPANRTADWLIWLPALVADQLWRQNFFDAGEPWVEDGNGEEFPSLFSTSTVAPTRLPAPSLAIANAPQPRNASPNPTLSPELSSIVQQIYRLQDEQGLEVIYGTLRADFVAGQRTAVIHVGFCPPLPYLPEIEAEALPGQSVKIKTVQSLAHGTRLDVRLSAAAAADCQIWIDMAARPMETQQIDSQRTDSQRTDSQRTDSQRTDS